MADVGPTHSMILPLMAIAASVNSPSSSFIVARCEMLVSRRVPLGAAMVLCMIKSVQKC